MLHVDNAYFVPKMKVTGQVCRTNLPPNTAFRGFGGPQGMAVIEHCLQEISRVVGRDALDVRQLNPHDLRRSIGYMPQETELFSGTIGDNLRLANPIAGEHALIEACERAGVLDEVEDLPKRFNTRLSEQDIKQISSGFGRGLCLARTYLTEAPIMLFDEPGTALDHESDQAFIRALHHMRGQVTCLVVTHRPSHIRAADRVLVMSGGMIGYDGTPGDMAEVIAGAAQ